MVVVEVVVVVGLDRIITGVVDVRLFGGQLCPLEVLKSEGL